MFYDINVMNSKSLGVAWRHANQLPGDTSSVGLTKICSSLNKCIETGRVSLRASSMLVNGAARVYKDAADQLYKDCMKLNKEMIRRYNRPPIEIDSVSKPNEKDSRSFRMKNFNIFQVAAFKRQRNSDTYDEYSPRKRNNPDPIQESQYEMSAAICLENDLTHTSNNNDQGSNLKTTNEIAVQTIKSFISNRGNNFFSSNLIDESQPYALVMVSDGTSRIPRKFICSNINV